MATVPIEIIVQDYVPEETPGDDTPGTITPEESNTTEELSVPDTGLFSNNPTATIITSSSILLFAIATIITLFAIRKQHKATKQAKQQEAKQQTRLNIATASTLSIIAITALITQLFLSTVIQPILSNAIDDEPNNDNGTTIETPDKITIEITRTEDEDNTIIATAENISYVSSDLNDGYNVYLSGSKKDTKLYLNGDEESEYYISEVADGTELSDNTWGYNTDGEDIYYGFTSHAHKLIGEDNEEAEDKPYDTYYAVKITKDLPAGTYTGVEVEYTVDSKLQFPSVLKNMQDMTTEICNSVITPGGLDISDWYLDEWDRWNIDINTITNVPTATLTDTRNGNKTYSIAKLADGRCWMTQNLDLDIQPGTKYTNEDTDLGWNAETSSYDEAEWTPSEGTRVTANRYWVGVGVQQSYDPGDKCWSGTLYDENLVDCAQENSHYHLGNVYNWAAAVAMNETSPNPNNNTPYYKGDSNPPVYIVDQSICPAGWTLPKGGRGLRDSDFGVLISHYSEESYIDYDDDSDTYGQYVDYNYDNFSGYYDGSVRGEDMVSNLSYLTLGGGNLPQGSRGRVGSAGYYWTNTSFGWIDGFMLAEYLTVAPLEDYGNTTIYFRWRPYHELRYSSWDPNFIRCIAR